MKYKYYYVLPAIHVVQGEIQIYWKLAFACVDINLSEKRKALDEYVFS